MEARGREGRGREGRRQEGRGQEGRGQEAEDVNLGRRRGDSKERELQ